MNQRMLLDFLQLTFCNSIGPLTFQNLLAHFSSATEILKAPASALQQIPRIGGKTIQAIHDSQTIRAKMQNQIELCQSHDIEIVPYTSQRYPAPLKHIPAPPPVIFCQGNLTLLQHGWPTQNTIAIVGARGESQSWPDRVCLYPSLCSTYQRYSFRTVRASERERPRPQKCSSRTTNDSRCVRDCAVGRRRRCRPPPTLTLLLQAIVIHVGRPPTRERRRDGLRARCQSRNGRWWL